MKKMNHLLGLLVALLMITGAKAQDVNSDAGVTRKLFQAEHRNILQDNMHLTASQAQAFWRIYDQYENERRLVADRNIELLNKISAGVDTTKPYTAEDISEKSIDNQMDLLKLQKKYAKKISKEVSPVVSARFVQVEQTINAKIYSEMMSKMPLVGVKK